MYLEILKPTGVIFQGEVSSVSLPGEVGRFHILENHAPLVSTLAKGDLSILISTPLDKKETSHLSKNEEEKNSFSYTIDGGAVKVGNNKIIVLV